MARDLTHHDYEQLSAYLDGDLDEAERLALEARLRDEPALRRELEALRATVALIRGLPPIKAPRDFTLTAQMARPPRLLFLPTTAAFSAISAAAATLLVGLGLVVLLSRGGPMNAPLQVADEPAVALQMTMPAEQETARQNMTATLIAATPLAGMALEFAEAAASAVQDSALQGEDQAAPADAMLTPAPAGALPEVAQENAALPTGTVGRVVGAQAEDLSDDRLTGTPAQPPAFLPQPSAAQFTPPPGASATLTGTPPPTPTLTPSPMPTPVPPQAAPPASDALAVVLLAAGGVLLALALVTTVIRRRS
ncbi:MAG: hypothetical protein HXY41_06570 [Chloroflexi bacterium]|nr:hypothetical protein [Chloroflexota bacterium]